MEKASRTMKKIVWRSECGEGIYPFCPYCDELAYEKDKCVFCGKPYEWTEDPAPPTIVEVGDCKVIQTSNNHIQIYNGEGRLVYHATCTKKMTKEQLIEEYKFYEEIRKE